MTMGKPSKPKKAKKVSIHSRAARRATSPSIDTDKSLKNTELPKGNSTFLHYRHGGGISKRKAKVGPLKRQKRLRKEKEIQRAEAVLEQLEEKVEKSRTKGRQVKRRRNDWEDVNGKLEKVKPSGGGARKTEPAENDEWEDVEDSESEEDVTAAVTALKVTDASNASAAVEDEDKIL